LRIKKPKKFRTLEEEILLLQKEGRSTALSIAEILRVLSGKGRTIILILLSLPFCQPIQIPGFSTPFGLAVAFIGLRMVFGKTIWLPEKLLQKNVSSDVLIKITDNALNIIRKMKPWVHPRFIWLCQSSILEKGNGLLICLLGILLALPLPIPLSNLTAAWSIFFIAFGVLEDDGLFILIGYLISLITLVFFLVIALSVTNYLIPNYLL
jgi:hypothetical protein